MAVLNEEQARACMHKLLAAMSQEFARDFECNFAIAAGIPNFEKLRLPEVLVAESLATPLSSRAADR